MIQRIIRLAVLATAIFSVSGAMAVLTSSDAEARHKSRNSNSIRSSNDSVRGSVFTPRLNAIEVPVQGNTTF
jgi:hypothetical protein